MNDTEKIVTIFGGSRCTQDAPEYKQAMEVGRLLASAGYTICTGGYLGVMEAASRGAHEAGGLVIGLLPGGDPDDANPYVDVALPTRMGQLRNGLVVGSAAAVIAVGGEWGTLSEIGLALKMGKPVIGWHTWELAQDGRPREGIVRVATAEEAVHEAWSRGMDA